MAPAAADRIRSLLSSLMLAPVPEPAAGPDPAVATDILAGDLAVPAPLVKPQAWCADAFDLLAQHPETPALCVVEDDRIVGMVDRASLFSTFAKPLQRDLYAKRPVALLMDRSPLIVDRRTPIAVVGERIAREKPSAVSSGFLIVGPGWPIGAGTAIDLMARTAEQAERKALELDAARRAAEAANAAKGRFLANMSHELRTPLNAIIGFAELIESGLFGDLDDRYKDYAGDIRTSGEHLLGLINDLLDLSKADADRLDLIEEWLHLPSATVACARLVRPRADAAGVTVTTQFAPGLPPLHADARRLRQMLLNLLSNAVKFTPAGGAIAVSAELDAQGWLAVAIADTGIGMSEDEQRTALEPFGQVDNLLSRRHQGTGLGLPLTRRLVELHGGRFEMASRPGAGTTITLRFPSHRLAAGGEAV